jgi:signal peptidase I
MRSLWRLLLWGAVIAAVIIGALRLVAIRWWRLPTNDPWLDASVEPTLRGGDLVVLWRLTPPHYGELVICPEPGAPERVVVGRILGEPGDNIVIDATMVTVNNRPITAERACSDPRTTVKHPRTGQPVNQDCEMENVGGALHPRATTGGQPGPPARVATTVPEGRVFLVSDNRLFPFDSRDYGPVERASCRETVIYRLLGQDGFFDVGRRFTYIP